MWLLTQTGLFSAIAYDASRPGPALQMPVDVSHPGDVLLIRARVEQDLTDMLDALELSRSELRALRELTTPTAHSSPEPSGSASSRMRPSGSTTRTSKPGSSRSKAASGTTPTRERGAPCARSRPLELQAKMDRDSDCHLGRLVGPLWPPSDPIKASDTDPGWSKLVDRVGAHEPERSSFRALVSNPTTTVRRVGYPPLEPHPRRLVALIRPSAATPLSVTSTDPCIAPVSRRTVTTAGFMRPKPLGTTATIRLSRARTGLGRGPREVCGVRGVDLRLIVGVVHPAHGRSRLASFLYVVTICSSSGEPARGSRLNSAEPT